MSNSQRRGGIKQFQIDGEVYDAKGDWTYNLGQGVRSTIMGDDGVHGYSETAQEPFLEGAVTDRPGLDVKAFVKMDGKTATLTLGNGKMIILRKAWYAGDGTVTTKEGEVAVRFVGTFAEEVSAA